MSEVTEISSAVTYNSEKDQFLLLKRSEGMDVFRGKWNFPSGKVEDSEKPSEAVLRELKEETGLIGEIVREGEPFKLETNFGVFKVYPYLILVKKHEIKLNSEHDEYCWIEPKDVENLETVKGLRRDLVSVGVLDEKQI